MSDSATEHIPVLADELAGQIDLPQDGVMVDATVGHGGHSFLFGSRLGPAGCIIGLDVDYESIQRAQFILKDLACEVILHRCNFSDIEEQLRKDEIENADFILADLGLCSGQIDDAQKGLSFRQDMPLDMRIDRSLETSAADIINKADEKHLADLIYEFGEDRASRRIARFIVRERQTEPITTTGQLASIVCRALSRGQKGRWRIHPATRTFQALRIAVNHELENLEALLEAAPRVLRAGGYMAVISFHSLEDRMVKNNFRQNAGDGIYDVMTKKPIVAGRAEIERNPRARSAKLRIARRVS